MPQTTILLLGVYTQYFGDNTQGKLIDTTWESIKTIRIELIRIPILQEHTEKENNKETQYLVLMLLGQFGQVHGATGWIWNYRDNTKLTNKQERVRITVEKIRKKVQKYRVGNPLGQISHKMFKRYALVDDKR